MSKEAMKMALEALQTAHLAVEDDMLADEIQQAITAILGALAEQPAQTLPFGVGGGLVAIKTLLSRDPCVHANTAIQMIDAILAEQPAQQEPVQKGILARKWLLHGSFADVANFDSEGVPSFYGKESVAKFQKGQLSAPCKGKKCGSLNGWLHSAECRAEHEAQYTTPQAQPAPVQGWKPSEADYKEWWDRHGLHGPTARAAFEDAASLYLTNAPQPAPVQRKPTTYTERFTHAVAVLCGAQPPADMVAEWLENVEVNGEHRLQGWVLTQAATPFWAQGIVVLDAAHVLANEPEEGEGHEDAPQAQPALCAPAADGVCESLDCPNHKPAQQEQEPEYIQLRHKEEDGFSPWGQPLDPKYRHDKWAADVEMRLLYTSPPANRKPLTLREIGAACGNFSDETIKVVRQTEAAHGIKENT